MARRQSHPLWAKAANFIARGMRQKDVAAILGVSPNTVSRWNSNPAYASLLKAECKRSQRRAAKAFDHTEAVKLEEREDSDYRRALLDASDKLRE